MNLRDARIVLRPRGIGEVLDLAVTWCSSVDLRVYARVAAVVLLPSLALCLAAHYWLQLPWWQVWLIAVALATVTQGAFTVASGNILFSRQTTARRSLATFGAALPSYFGALVISRIVLALGFGLVVLAPSAWSAMMYVHEASLLERQSPIDAAVRARRINQHDATDAVLFGGALAFAVAAFVVLSEMLGQGLVQFVLQLGKPFGALFDDGGSVYALIGFFLAVPYVAIARFLRYMDKRTRADGWDIQLRFMSLVAEHEDRTAGAGS